MSEEGKKTSEEKIELDPETYQALLTRLSDLEGEVKKAGETGEEETEVERLAREAAAEKGETGTEQVDYDALSNTQLIQTLEKDITANVLNPLLTRIEEVSLRIEIDQLTRQTDKDGKLLYGDFWDYKDEIYEISKDNPNLSLERAYKLATEGKGEKETTLKGKEGSEDLLRHLPTLKTPVGERPGVSVGTTEEEEPKDLKGAATKAYDEVFDKKAE